MDANKKFWTAVKKGQVKAVLGYLDQGQVFSIGENGNMPLHIAAKKGYMGLVQAFVDRGWSVNDQNLSGETPLMLAIQYGHRDVFQVLMEHKPNMSLKDQRNNTALLKAIWHCDHEMAEILLDNGSDVNVRNVDHCDALGMAISKDAADIVESIFRRGHGNPSAIIDASWRNAIQTVKRLIDMGTVDIDAQNKDGETALIIAVKRNSREMIEILVNAGADTEIKTKNGFKALDLAKIPVNENLFGFVKSVIENHQLSKSIDHAENNLGIDF